MGSFWLLISKRHPSSGFLVRPQIEGRRFDARRNHFLTGVSGKAANMRRSVSKCFLTVLQFLLLRVLFVVVVRVEIHGPMDKFKAALNHESQSRTLSRLFRGCGFLVCCFTEFP